jgi:DtxR family transcriptional regulator, Mn-dependent transcriptional regulator
MKETEELSESLEMYLKTIYLIEERKRASRVTDIANELGVIKSSVTGAMKTLSRKGLLNYAPYDIITLTDEGQRIARDILARYDGLRDFFIKVLGIEHDTAEAEACQMEHRISEAVFQRLLKFVDAYENSPCEKIRWDPEQGFFCNVERSGCTD